MKRAKVTIAALATHNLYPLVTSDDVPDMA
jgi:hypothetical protein